MEKPSKICHVVGCMKKHGSLHLVPGDGRRDKWLTFIFQGSVPGLIHKNTFVCANHFTRESFTNIGQYELGLAKHLVLKKEAIPTLRGDEDNETATLQIRTTRDVGFQTDPQQRRATRNVGFQTFVKPHRQSVGTQLSLKTFQPHVRTKAVQTVSCNDVGFGTSTVPGAAPQPCLISQPMKRPRLDLEEESTDMSCAANETSDGHPPLMKKDIPNLAPHNVVVNIACLLQLFQQCRQCSAECVVTKQEDKRHFTVIQHCQICNLLSIWTSQPFKEEESVDLCEVTGGNQEFTASLMMREWFDSKTSRREETLLTDEDIKMIKPAKLAESVVLPCEVREGDQESAASMMMMTMMMMGQTDREPSRKTSLLTEYEKKGKDQKSENTLDPFAEVELTIDSEEDCDGGEKEGEEAEEKGEGGVENKNMEKEEEEPESTEESETEEEEEEDEWEMEEEEVDDNSEIDDEEEEESEEEMDEVRKARKVGKRLRNGPDPLDHCRRKWKVKREQKRPETLCIDCGRLYKTRSHKCDPKKKFQCADCGIFLLTELSLSVHRKGHCRRRHQPCTFCYKPFKTRQDRLTHEMSHSGEKPYECPECPERFSTRLTRSRHIKEHQRRFRCQTCQKVFPDRSKLQRHEMSHSTDKPFKCEVCDRVFTQASQLKCHLRVHTGEKPFKCQLCPKCFNHNISLKNHIRRYHQGESHDNPAPAPREQGEDDHSPAPTPREQDHSPAPAPREQGEDDHSPAPREQGEDDHSPEPAPREQREDDHSPEPDPDARAEQERVEGKEMKDGRSQKHHTEGEQWRGGAGRSVASCSS